MEFSLSLDSCRSADDSFYIYERYMRTFQRSDHIVECNYDLHSAVPTLLESESAAPTPTDEELEEAIPPLAMGEECSLTAEPESLLDNDSSNKRAAASSDDTTRSDTSCRLPKPAIITLVSMENSNNATDGTRVFEPDPVFKLPNNELTFNGTLKHLQKLKPIVDPMAALNKVNYSETSQIIVEPCIVPETPINTLLTKFETSGSFHIESETESCVIESVDCSYTNGLVGNKEESCWSSIGASKGRESGESVVSCGGPPSPDLFSDEEEWSAPHSRLQEVFSQHETYDKLMLKKMEKTLSGVLPPPSVTTLRIDVKEMLKKYHCNLQLFQDASKETNTPSRGASCVTTPMEVTETMRGKNELRSTTNEPKKEGKTVSFVSVQDETKPRLVDNLNNSGQNIQIPQMGTDADAKNMPWPDILKCRFHDVHYNICSYSERVERAASRVAQRYVGEEMASSVTVFSMVGQSPSSAQKRKALRVKLAQSKSPGRRLSHLARRRQLFSAASLADKSQGTSKMVLIDKNFFPHRKLTYTTERRSPRLKKTPGRKTPAKKTPGKKTPGKGSSKKKLMRRLIMDSEAPTRTQPTRESSKRALFQSPENEKVTELPKTNPRAIKSRRNLFGSPSSDANRSLDNTPTDGSGKRKRDSFDMEGSSYKLHKSLSFGGEVVKSQTVHTSLARRATEIFSGRKSNELTALQKQKLLWAVSNALRAHGWRLGAPGFKEKASALAQLTRRMLLLPPHAARLAAAPSTSDYMLRLARKYVFSVIQGCSAEECYREEQLCLANEGSAKLTGYISAAAYQLLRTNKDLPHTAVSSNIKENTCDSITLKSDPPKSANKNVLQDKLVNIDSNSNSNSSFSVAEGSALFKSNSMPSFKEAAKLRARRQISFDDVDEPPKR